MRRLSLGRRGQGAFVVLATFGVMAREFAPPDSTLHTLGTLLSVLWIPIAIYAFVKLSDWFFKGRNGPPGFAPDMPVVHHLRIEATFRNAVAFERGPEDARLQCLLLLDSHAFTVRLLLPLGALPPAGEKTRQWTEEDLRGAIGVAIERFLLSSPELVAGPLYDVEVTSREAVM